MPVSLACVVLMGLLAAPVSGAAVEKSQSVGLARVDAKGLEKLLASPAPHPRLVHLWASWCEPCRAEWPFLAESLRRWQPRGLDIVLVALEEDDDGAAAATTVLSQLPRVPGVSVWATTGDLAPSVRSVDLGWDGSLPTTLLLAPDGHVVAAQRGITKTRELDEEIDRMTRNLATAKRKAASAVGNNERKMP